MNTEEKDHALFAGIVLMFHAAAMQQMGKVKNPSTDKIERNLEQAQTSIDMLDMLSRKTKGHLSEDEEQLLKRLSQELKLNYVDETSKDQAKAKESA